MCTPQNFCETHQKELKYLNYNLEQASVLLCRTCVKEKKLKDAFNMYKLIDEDAYPFNNIQEDNYQKMCKVFDRMQSVVERAAKDFCNSVEEIKYKISSIIQRQYQNQFEKDQANISYDLKASINNFSQGKMQREEFQQDVQYYFEKEKAISNHKDKRYHDISKFIKKITNQFTQFEQTLQETLDDLVEKYSTRNKHHLVLASWEDVMVEQNLNLYKRTFIQSPILQDQMLLYSQNDKVDVLQQTQQKTPKPINYNKLNSKNDLRMIVTKNKYENIDTITRILRHFLYYSNKLKVLSIKNINNISDSDLNDFSKQLSNTYFLKLTHIDLNLKRTGINSKFCGYLSKLSLLYPNLQHIRLSLKQQNIQEFINSLVEGLDKIKGNLITFQLKLFNISADNLEHFQPLFSNIIQQATNLKTLQLRFKLYSTQIIDKECYKYLFSQLVSSLANHNSLQALDFSVPSIKEDISDETIKGFAQIISLQQELTCFRINIGNMPFIKAKQINQITKSLLNSTQLMCLEFSLLKTTNIDEQMMKHLKEIIQKNQSIQILKIDLSFAEQINEENVLQLCKQIQFLNNLVKLNLKFNQREDIGDAPLNYLVESLQQIHKKSTLMNLEVFQIDLRNSKQITNQPMLDLIMILSFAKNLKKLKLSFFKNNLITTQPLMHLISCLEEKSFPNLTDIVLEFGSNKFNNEILSKLLEQLQNQDMLTKIRLFFGYSLFNKDLLLDLSKLVNKCIYLQCVDFNFFKSNALESKFLKILLRNISNLEYINELRLDFYYMKIEIDQFLESMLKKIESKLDKVQFSFKVNEHVFNNTKLIRTYSKQITKEPNQNLLNQQNETPNKYLPN